MEAVLKALGLHSSLVWLDLVDMFVGVESWVS